MSLSYMHAYICIHICQHRGASCNVPLYEGKAPLLGEVAQKTTHIFFFKARAREQHNPTPLRERLDGRPRANPNPLLSHLYLSHSYIILTLTLALFKARLEDLHRRIEASRAEKSQLEAMMAAESQAAEVRASVVRSELEGQLKDKEAA